MKKVFLTIAILSILVTSTSFASYNANDAKNYLLNNLQSPWSVMALASLGVNAENLDFLKNVSSNNAIDYEAPILAITAMSKDPATFASQNYYSKLRSLITEEQIGDPNLLNDDYFGILALSSSGLSPSEPEISNSKKYILSHQNNDGGFGWSISSTSDSNDTAAAIMALISAGVPPTDQKIINALEYLKTAQNSDGGFTYDPQSPYGTQSDSSSTAWVLMALNALGIDQAGWTKDGKTPKSYLENNQNTLGYFQNDNSDTSESQFNKVVTAYSVIALSGKTLPVNKSPYQNSSEVFSFRLEGENETLCEGKAAGPTAFDLVKNATEMCSLSYHVTEYSFGPYIDTIGNDSSSGSKGWQYAVNYQIPGKGANEYTLNSGDEVLWYFGPFDLKLAKISSQTQEVSSGNSITILTEELSGEVWKNMQNATIKTGASVFQSNQSGEALISLPDGYYKTYAEKAGYVRSNKLLLKFGTPASSNVNLSAEIESGQVAGEDTQNPQNPGIGFTVDTTNLDFGKITNGTSSTKNFKITSTSNTDIIIQTNINGDTLFKDNLSFNDKPWTNFRLPLSPNEEKTISAKLNIPSTYTGSKGGKLGQIVIWATAN